MNSVTERGEFIRVSEPEKGIWVLRLNRPEVMNAWHGPMRAELAQVMNEIAIVPAIVAFERVSPLRAEAPPYNPWLKVLG